MKIILSRKGFDSSYGGYPSPILPDGTMLSMPIPIQNNLSYSQLRFSENETYLDIMTQFYPELKKAKKKLLLNKFTKCHLDPDLNPYTIKRNANWKPMFGQAKAAQSHLEKKNVQINDIFLFFGLFQKTKIINKKLVFDKSEKPFHCIWGYLQIGSIIKNDEIKKLKHYHPHTESSLISEKNNTIYIAADNLSIATKRNGSGVFNFNKKLVLTKNGFNKSQWELPDFFKELDISYHSNTKNNGFKKDYFQSAGIGQEFVIQEDVRVTNWFKELIK